MIRTGKIIFARHRYEKPGKDQRTVGHDGELKPRWNLTPIMLGAAGAQVFGIGLTVWTQGWLGVWLGGTQAMVLVMVVMTWRLWDFTSREPGTGAYDMRHGTDTVTQFAAARSVADTGHGSDSMAPPMPDPAEVKATAIRAAIEETGDPYARREDGP